MNISLRLSLVFLIIVLVGIFTAPSSVAPQDPPGCRIRPGTVSDVSFDYQQLFLQLEGGYYV